MLVLLIGCGGDEPAEDKRGASVAAGRLAVEAPWARVGPEGGMSAAYARLLNGFAYADTLRQVATDAARRVELHEATETADGLRGMRRVDMVPVPAGAEVALEPGGLHVMLIGLTRDLAAGDSLTLELTFAESGTRHVTIPVRSLAP